ncbi:protein DEHYDRATION-INDUCED 19 isoform X1 [Ziziphus jujuba]|uniref:Protein DEHYDRATION-INDUCED 19 isoform X1 n=1 Tax=Ziziphus jujuba TaxID=326968 RepID=A0A6P4B103_ZIZJJ|nr:protein DEHYDRATION-INDUCED 19 isoform X1 [Ziziphus jujuba]
MEDDAWSFGVTSASRSYNPSMLKSHSDFCIDFEDFDGDDDLKVEYPCPFCSEDFDLVGLCCHIDDEHHSEARSVVCPVCATRVGMNMVGHITTQHGNFFNQYKVKFYKVDSQSPFSFSRKELQDEHIRSLFGWSSAVSTSKMAPDPLLSFLYNTSPTDRSEKAQPDSSSEVSNEEKSSDHILLERNIQKSPLSDKDQEEKAERCKFAQGLVLSTIFDDGL